MPILIKILKMMVCVVAGGVLGGFVGIGLIWIIVIVALYFSDDDATGLGVGGLTLLGLATVPIGTFIGLGTGAAVGMRWIKEPDRRGFDVVSHPDKKQVEEQN